MVEKLDMVISAKKSMTLKAIEHLSKQLKIYKIDDWTEKELNDFITKTVSEFIKKEME